MHAHGSLVRLNAADLPNGSSYTKYIRDVGELLFCVEQPHDDKICICEVYFHIAKVTVSIYFYRLHVIWEPE